jgi:hypothetical protein
VILLEVKIKMDGDSVSGDSVECKLRLAMENQIKSIVKNTAKRIETKLDYKADLVAKGYSQKHGVGSLLS